MNQREFYKRFGPAFETGRYAEKAGTYCVNKFGSVEGNEIIFAAVLISQAICASRFEMAELSERLIDKVDDLLQKLDDLDIRANLDSIEEAISEVDAAVTDLRTVF